MNHGLGLFWKLRRVAAGKRQQDVANGIGISTSRYSGIERGDVFPTELERELIEQALPPLPAQVVVATAKANGAIAEVIA